MSKATVARNIKSWLLLMSDAANKRPETTFITFFAKRVYLPDDAVNANAVDDWDGDWEVTVMWPEVEDHDYVVHVWRRGSSTGVHSFRTEAAQMLERKMRELMGWQT